MSNPHGSPIWYDLTTPDPVGAKRFYDDVIGWTIEAEPQGAHDYRMIASPAGLVGGVLRLTEDMLAAGGQPCWLMYVAVADVDALAAQARGLGGHVVVPPTDIANVGRFALLVDPQGAPFYVMRDDSGETSHAYAPGRPGHCGWNELSTTDMAGALAFYTALFGWENRETMDMGPMGGYHFLDLGEVRLGAAAEMKAAPPRWTLYFTVPDIDIAIERVRAGGGSIEIGPHTVPSGEQIVHGTDPQKAHFALVAPARP